ncbi:MAG TPA: DUF916 domain-containing protein [Dehalococcoidia bacterium]|nr:DUF916 domain-containing protein [Dehalococcoidia bacterium]
MQLLFRRTLLAAGLAALICLSVLPTTFGRRARAEEGGARFGLQPVNYDAAVPATRSYFVFDGAPAATIRSQVRVVNTGSSAGTVQLYAVDATTGQTSGTVYLGRQDPRADVGAWANLDTKELTLAPGEQRLVSFTIAVPADARAGQHVGGLVAEDTAIRHASGAGTSINVQNLMVLAIQVNVPGAEAEQLTVDRITAAAGGGYQTLLLATHNTGTQMLKPQGVLTVTDAHGATAGQWPLALDTVLPQTSIEYPVYVQSAPLPPGEYTGVLALQYGAGHEEHERLAFSIPEAAATAIYQSQAPLTPVQSTAAVPAAQATGKAATGQRLLAVLVGLLLILIPLAWLLGRRRPLRR